MPINPADLSSWQWIEMAVFASASMTGSFQGLNLAANYSIYTGDGFEADIKSMLFYNGSTQGIIISYDGVTPHDFWPEGSTRIIDIQTNHANNSAYGSGTLCGRKGQIVYGKGTAGAGNIYIMGFR